MADRDVKLIIRAKNEATRAIDSVSDALKELNKSQDDTGRSAAKTDGLLGELGSEFSRLNKEIAGLNALSRVSTELGKVEKAVNRLEGETRQSAGEFAKYAREAERATATTARLKAQTDQFREAVKREEDALRSRRDERRKANAELRKSETAYRRLQAAIDKQKRGGTPAAASADAFLSADAEKARAAAERASAAFDEQNTAVRQAKAALKEHSAELRNSESAQARVEKATREAAAATSQNRAALDRSRTVLGEIRSTANSAAQALGGVAVEQREIAEASRQTAATLDAVGAELAAMRRFSDGGGGFASPEAAESIRRQREEIDRARAAYELLEARAQRLAAAQQRIGPPTRNAAAAQRQAADAARVAKEEMERQIAVLNRMPGALGRVRGIRGVFSDIYGDSRQAMSTFQRLRGELLSLTTAYVGLYGTIQNIGGVVTAYQQMEAAQNRLGAAFGQNGTAVRNELGWIERQAARLGISFGELSNQYSKFTIAAKAANFQNDNTRKIFLSVAEAGRVNKLSLEDMTGVFRALEQMISKGKIQAEELRQQLGDRLPGAFSILADALGKSTAELNAMMEAGTLIADESTLLKFADELVERFGPQLAEALKSTTTLIGQFQNELFQARLRVGDGGFIEAFNEALAEMNAWFRSREGRDFFLSLGAALGRFVKVLAQVPQWFTEIGYLIKLLIGFQLARVILGWTTGVRTASGAFVTLAGALTSVKAGAASAMVGVNGLIARFRMARAAGLTLATTLRTISALFMRIPALAILTAATWLTTELIAGWVGGVDDATAALDRHDQFMGKILTAYDKLKGKTDAWAKALEEVTADEASLNFRRAYDTLQQELDNFGSNTTAKFDRLTGKAKELFDLRQAVRNGEMTIGAFISRVSEMYGDIEDENTRLFAEELLEGARKAEIFAEAVGVAARVARDKGIVTREVSEALHLYHTTQEDVTETTEAASDAMDDATESVNGYGEALNKVKGMIPELADEMAKLADMAKLDEAYAAMMKNARTMGQVMQANQWYDRARSSINERYTDYEAVYTGQRGTPQGARMEELVSATVRLAEQMGLSAKDLLSVMSFETKGTFDPWKKGPTTQWGTHRGLIQWGEPQAAQYGVTATTSITDQVMAVGKYLADAGVKAGDGLMQIYAAVLAGDARKVNAGDKHNGGVVDSVSGAVNGAQFEGHKAKAEGLLAAYAGIAEQTREIVQNERAANEERVQQGEATQRQIADNEFEISQQQLIEAGKGRQAAIEEAIRQAKEANKHITQEQLALIAEQTGRLYDMQNATAGVEAAEKRVNELLQIRQQLTEQLRLHQEMGNTGQVEGLTLSLNQINAQLEQAIANAIKMWEAIGGPQADLHIAKLNTTKLSIQQIGEQAAISGDMIADRLTGALVGAFKAAAKAIAEGKDAWEAFQTAFLQGIAEMLIEIGELILKQAILNALRGFFGGFGGGGGGLLGGLLRHEGGPVGAGGHTRAVAPGWFAGAMRLHEGGVAGLRPNEVPAILEKGEVVDPGDGSVFRKMFGGGDQQPPSVRIVNAFDSGEVVSEGLNSAVGEQTVLNVVKRNAGKIRQLIG